MRFLSIILGCCLLSGCSGGTAEDMPEVAPVTGKVTLDGNSLKGVMIRFEPIEGGRSSLATSDDEGNYVLEYNSNTPGAKIGEHRVILSTFQEPSDNEQGEFIPGRKEEIPKKYAATDILKVQVKPDDNTIDLELTK